MSELAVFLAVAIILLVVLLVWALHAPETVACRTDISSAQEILGNFRLALPPRALVDRIFSPEDRDFVSTESSPQLQQIFLRGRKAVALSWLRHTRQKVRELMYFHASAVRRNVNLSPAFEVRLAANYIFIVLLCQVLSVLVWLRGPFGTQAVVRYAVGMTEQLSLLTGSVLTGLNPEKLARVRTEWNKRSVTA